MCNPFVMQYAKYFQITTILGFENINPFNKPYPIAKAGASSIAHIPYLYQHLNAVKCILEINIMLIFSVGVRYELKYPNRIQKKLARLSIICIIK